MLAAVDLNRWHDIHSCTYCMNTFFPTNRHKAPAVQISARGLSGPRSIPMGGKSKEKKKKGAPSDMKILLTGSKATLLHEWMAVQFAVSAKQVFTQAVKMKWTLHCSPITHHPPTKSVSVKTACWHGEPCVCAASTSNNTATFHFAKQNNERVLLTPVFLAIYKNEGCLKT